MNKKYILSAIAATALTAVLSGCGSSNTTTTTATDTLSGLAVDGYLSGATVCLDTNANNVCDTTEPNTTTASDGSFTLDLSSVSLQVKQTAQLLVYGGEDIATARPFVGILKAPLYDDANVNITPITTMLAAKVETNDDLDINAAKAEIAGALGITEAEITLDPVKAQNKELYKHALKIQKTIEVLVEAVKEINSTIEDDSQDFEIITDQIAQGFTGATVDITTIINAIDFSVIPGFENGELVKLIVTKVNEIIDTNTLTTQEDIQRISYLIENLRETIKQRIEEAKRGGQFENGVFNEDSLITEIDDDSTNFDEGTEKIKRFIEAIDLDVTDIVKEEVLTVLANYQIQFTFSNTLEEYKTLIANTSFDIAHLATKEMLLAAISYKIADQADD